MQTIPTSHVVVSTSQYEFAHGKAPRGEGSWGFYIAGSPDVFWAPFGTYREAKRLASVEAASRGSRYVSVAS